MIHSLAAQRLAVPCEASIRLPQPRLRPYVLGYSGFHTGAGPPLRRRILPLNLATLIIDFADAGAVVTGPRSVPVVHETAWRYGISIGLTPAGVSALLGPPMRELVGMTVPLADLLGRRAARLADRLAEAPDWPARYAVLDERLAAWIAPDRTPGGLVARAWWRLQAPADRVTVGGLADELGVSRRYLEAGFQRQVGIPPKTVARIARFQRAVTALARPSASLQTAVACGFADQPHFTREVRAMSGVTPTELCAFVQDTVRLAD